MVRFRICTRAWEARKFARVAGTAAALPRLCLVGIVFAYDAPIGFGGFSCACAMFAFGAICWTSKALRNLSGYVSENARPTQFAIWLGVLILVLATKTNGAPRAAHIASLFQVIWKVGLFVALIVFTKKKKRDSPEYLHFLLLLNIIIFTLEQ